MRSCGWFGASGDGQSRELVTSAPLLPLRFHPTQLSSSTLQLPRRPLLRPLHTSQPPLQTLFCSKQYKRRQASRPRYHTGTITHHLSTIFLPPTAPAPPLLATIGRLAPPPSPSSSVGGGAGAPKSSTTTGGGRGGAGLGGAVGRERGWFLSVIAAKFVLEGGGGCLRREVVDPESSPSRLGRWTLRCAATSCTCGSTPRINKKAVWMF